MILDNLNRFKFKFSACIDLAIPVKAVSGCIQRRLKPSKMTANSQYIPDSTDTYLYMKATIVPV